MTRAKRVFTPEERLSLLQEAEREGFSETCRKHNLSPGLLALWRKKYLAKGAEGLKPSYRRVDPQVKALDLFDNLNQVREETEKFIWKYNNIRPHDSLENITPRAFLLKCGKLPTAQTPAEFPTFQRGDYNNNYYFQS